MSNYTAAQIPNVLRRFRRGGGLILCLLPALLWGGVASGQPQKLTIFDAHIHYNQPDWGVISAEQVLSILSQQAPRMARLQAADHVIYNDGLSLDDLRAEVLLFATHIEL